MAVGLYVVARRQALPDALVLQFGTGPQRTTLPALAAGLVFLALLTSVCLSHAWLQRAVGEGTTGVFTGASIAWLIALGTGAAALVHMNLTGSSAGSAYVGGAIAVALAATTLVAVGAEPASAPDAAATVLTHRSPWLALAFALVLFGVVTLGVRVCPDWVCRAITLLVSALVLWAGALTASGFKYRAAEDRIEVIGVRSVLASVPVKSIAAARAGTLDRFVGYGIRGIPGGRAFVLGGRTGVWIETADETLFLAYDDPPRLLALIERARGRR